MRKSHELKERATTSVTEHPVWMGLLGGLAVAAFTSRARRNRFDGDRERFERYGGRPGGRFNYPEDERYALRGRYEEEPGYYEAGYYPSGREASEGEGGLKDKARSAAETAKEKVQSGLESTKEAAGHAKERASELLGSAREKVTGHGQDRYGMQEPGSMHEARERFSGWYEERVHQQPLTTALAAVALGAAAAMLLPVSRPEQRLVEPVKSRAREGIGRLGERLEENLSGETAERDRGGAPMH